MPASGILTLKKEERICSRALTERLFTGGGGRSMTAFPLRLVYMKAEADGSCPAVRVLFSVPKRCFKRAVKRNRVKRQLREAYRLNKGILYERLGEQGGMGVALAFIWLDDKLWPTPDVERRVVNLMQRLAERTGRL